MAAWTADALLQPIQEVTTHQARSIIDDLFSEWVPDEIADVQSLTTWACERFDTTLEDITQESLKQAVSKRIMQFKKIFEIVRADPELREDAIVKEKVERIAKVMRECRNAVQATAILFYQLDDTRHNAIPDSWNPDDFFKYVEEDDKATTFQRLLMVVCRRLAIDEMRKLDDMCYQEIIVKKTGERSHAWKQVIPIKDYIFERIQKETDYDVWKCLTNPHDNCDKVVNHLINSSQIEFPPLIMNRYLWAYNNGLYNVLEDTFWPFQSAHIRSVRDVSVAEVQRLLVHTVRADDDELQIEDADLTTDDGVHVWNVSTDGETLLPETCFKIADQFYTNFLGREAWPKLAQDIITFRHGLQLGNLNDVTRESVCRLTPFEELSVLPDDAIATVVDDNVRVWNIDANGALCLDTIFAVDDSYYSNIRCGVHFASIESVKAPKMRQVAKAKKLVERGAYAPKPIREPEQPPDASVEGVDVWYAEEHGALTTRSILRIDGECYSNAKEVEVWTTPKGEPYNVVVPTAEDVAVKHFDIDFRFEITPEAEMSFDPSEVRLPEMEKIMTTQQLDVDSQEWLVLMLCRLFFPTGYDRWQVVLFIKGIAGSGKSTLAQIIRSFYPPSRITTLSSNIEAKFGLSAIYKGLVCICAEVRDDFGLDQAEWQSCVSGEEVQVAVKQKTAFAHKWDTPFFFLGNQLPNYQNAAGSVDRRFFMIEFRHRVLQSDPGLFDKFMRNIDLFQRKGVSLYHKKLRQHGSKDIWAEGVVGEQLLQWKKNVKESSDALYAFITSGRFIAQTENYMPLSDFKEMYNEYRRSSGYDKVKWTLDHYDSIFQGEGLHTKEDTLEYGGTRKTRVYLIGLDIKPDDDSMGDQ